MARAGTFEIISMLPNHPDVAISGSLALDLLFAGQIRHDRGIGSAGLYLAMGLLRQITIWTDSIEA